MHESINTDKAALPTYSTFEDKEINFNIVKINTIEEFNL